MTFWLLDFLFPFAVLYLLIAHVRLRRRMTRLENRLRGADAETSVAPPLPAVDPSEPPALAPADPEGQTAPEAIQSPETGEDRPRGDFGKPMRGPHRGAGFATTVSAWLKENWFYAVSALSLALAGLYSAQYAAESGLLEPPIRIALATLFGVALIGGGEVVRRRAGDGTDIATAYLPSVFSGAGLVTLFGAVLTAHTLYGMIGGDRALAGLVAVAALAVALGWFYGPLLTAIGIAGGTVAPFLTGGGLGSVVLIHAYFGVVAIAGLTINALRRWRWMDAASLGFPYAASVFVLVQIGGSAAFILMSVGLCLAAAVLSNGSWSPKVAGPAVLLSNVLGRRGRPSAAAVMLLGFWIAAITWIVLASASAWVPGGADILGIVGLGILFGISAIWTRRSDAMLDLPVVSAFGLFALVVLRAPGSGLIRAVGPSLSDPDPVASIRAGVYDAPLLVLIAVGLAMALAAAWRSRAETGRKAAGWAICAGFVASGLLVLLEITWTPSGIIGPGWWSAVAMAFAAIATIAAERASRIDGPDRLRVSLGALVAMSMIALALFVLLTKAALSVALAVLVLGAVALDDRFRLPAMTWFVQAGVMVLVYRSVADPGIPWGMEASPFDLLLAFGAPAIALAAAWLLLRGRGRPLGRSVVEGGLAVVAGTGISILVARATEALAPAGDATTHWGLGLTASIWLIAGATSLRNAMAVQAAGYATPAPFARKLPRLVRFASAALSFLVAAGALLLALADDNPILSADEEIVGVVGLSSLMPAYLVPGLLIAVTAVLVPGLSTKLRRIGMGAGGLLAFLYVCLSVAQAWRGDVLAGVPVGDGEQWSYTAVLLIAGGGMLVVALKVGSTLLRHLANGVLIIAIAKVFVVDASDLDGLLRAASFLILGLALAGLAWINRRAKLRTPL